MGRMQKNKGAGGEREVIAYLQPVVTRVYRAAGHADEDVPKLVRNLTQTREGGYDIEGLAWMALEVKRCEKLAVPAWWRQAVRQAGAGQVPVLWYRQNKTPWRVMLPVVIAAGVQRMVAMTLTMEMGQFLEWFEARLTEEVQK